MKKIFAVLLSALNLVSIHALDMETGLFFSGGVKTGLLIKSSDYGGELGNQATNPDYKYPMTLYFSSYENHARNGEGWLSIGYSRSDEGIGKYGMQLGLWAHGDVKTYSDIVRLGDHFVWANFFDERLRFIGGQGGGTPINSGGWINADWLSYTGLRLFWVDPSGISAGINFPDPGTDGIKPVNYLSLLMAGLSYKYKNWSISLQFDNSPIYDDTEANLYGGLHRPADQDPIGLAGNIAFGIGIDKLYDDKISIVLEGLVSNLGEDEEDGKGDYKISPVKTTFAIKTSYKTEQLYAEIKGKYTISQGDADDPVSASSPSTWGKLEFEPFVSFQTADYLRFFLSVYGALYVNSYYLALDWNKVYQFKEGQVPGYGPLLDYLSPYFIKVKPGVGLTFGGVAMDMGYEGALSRDHIENNFYIDFKWSF